MLRTIIRETLTNRNVIQKYEGYIRGKSNCMQFRKAGADFLGKCMKMWIFEQQIEPMVYTGFRY